MSRLDKMQMNEFVNVDYIGFKLPPRTHRQHNPQKNAAFARLFNDIHYCFVCISVGRLCGL